MSEQPGADGDEGDRTLDDIEERLGAAEARNHALVGTLRETAKWIVSGIAVTAGGVIAGSSLTSLGSLDPGPRLALAAGSAALGFVALGRVLWIALDVLFPRSYDMASITGGEVLGRDKARVLELAARDGPDGAPGIERVVMEFRHRFHAYAAERARGQLNPQERDKLVASAAYIQRFLSNTSYHHHRIQFLRLRRAVLFLAPVVALGFGVFAWAANPGKDGPTDIAPVARDVDVAAQDRAALEAVLGGPGCVGQRISVVLHRRWASGAHDAIVTPGGACRAARLFLDGGRLRPSG